MGQWRNQRVNKKMETSEYKNTAVQNFWDPAKAVLRKEIYNNTGLPQKIIISNKEHNVIPEEPRKRKKQNKKTKTKPKVSKRKKIIKIRVKINKVETEKNNRKDQWNRVGFLKR